MRERIIFQSDGVFDDPFQIEGTLEGWQNNVARYAAGNSRLAFALSAAFAGPLLYPTEGESGGFHFRGGSSIGKTTTLQIAASVWGNRDFIRSWRATSNGLESIAALHNDNLLLLDEMGQVDSREVGQIAYMIANGTGKTRAGRSGEARKAMRWRTIFLSTGEVGLADKIAEDGRGRRAAAGQEVRIIDIPAEAGAGMGIFGNLHGFASADAFARHLKTASARNYGNACRAFLEYLVKDFDGIAPMVNGYCGEFLAEALPEKVDGQISRGAARFALVAAAGEMATAFGILPWSQGKATRASRRLFRDWLDARGGTEPAEEREAISAVRRFIELHGTARFEPMGTLIPTTDIGEPIDVRISNRAGFRRMSEAGGTEYIVMPEVWKSEVCAGMDASRVAKTLIARGLLVPGSNGKAQNFQRVPGSPNPIRCYLLSPAILGEADA